MPNKKYNDWLAELIQGKKEVPALETGEKYAIHSVRRYIDTRGNVWETAITYTGRLVVRTGKIGPDGINVTWEDWSTQHDIEVTM